MDPRAHQHNDGIGSEVANTRVPDSLVGSIEGDLDESKLVIVFFRDWQQVQAARRSDTAFEALMSEYGWLIQSMASKYFLCGGSHDDLAQEARWGFCKAVQDYDGKQSPFRSFAEMCVERQVITAVKTASRFKHTPLNDYVSFSQSPAGHEDSEELCVGDSLPDRGRLTEDIVIGNETLKQLIDALTDELSYAEYTCLKMFLEDKSYEAIAEELCIDTKTVDNALQRVKRKILTLMDNVS